MTEWLKTEIELYKKNHQRSLALWKKAQEQFPAGVSHNIRDFHMTPFGLSPPFIVQGKESQLFDVDGNSYIDYWVTHGSAILGHAHPAIMRAISDQLSFGIHFGMVNEHTLNLAEMIIDATPCVEKLRFCTTGTEATMYASRLARAYTKKKKIVKVRGGWHGGNDTLFYFVKEVQKGVESAGLKSLEDSQILSFDYNDIEGFKKVLNENKNDIAAVILEPVLGAGGAIPPKEGFLEEIQEETQKRGIILIFDEIITGFRLSYHSAQGFFNVIPDMVTMGKIVGGGTPIGVIGGTDEIMEQANLQKGGEVWIGGGTFSGNPLSMVAGRATLETLRSNKDEFYRKLNENGKMIRQRIQSLLDEYNSPAVVTGVGSMICIHWFDKPLAKISSSSEIKLNLAKEKVNQFQLLMFNRGLLIRSGFGYLCIKHTSKDIEKTLNALEDGIKIISHGT
ncbi:MAG: aspartate aminotransferase family protein [Candidatus Heimdallarchaeota archaeon]|nr:MAG: hypothetical protein DRO63_02905 [Candidatus Gerdarchaeota archaeon]RLI70164.1 MAG: hypothetical protein DRO91_07035 [Candidatus Heimdallarchaeota archaeon]RLI70215.1 MAG: hypothetical protein DRP02_08505 [Candidatus Gerdarchaeota archaeon]